MLTIFLVFRMDWTSGTPDGGGEESIDRITMLRSLLGQFIPPVCECLGLIPGLFLTVYLYMRRIISTRIKLRRFRLIRFSVDDRFVIETRAIENTGKRFQVET